MLENIHIPDYREFLTLEELDAAAHALSKKYNFRLEQVGSSEKGHPIYSIKAGNGLKKLFLWGFPHPNEPIGSLLIDALIHHVGTYPELQERYTWHFLYTIDPDGTKLNESWFKGKLTLEKYFRGFYRQSANRMIDWTFPIEYKKSKWNKPLKETQIIMKLIKEIQPDVMYPLHNSGFGGAYFFATKKFSDNYYENIRKITKQLGIPLHEGEPEEPFMVEIEGQKPFYYTFGFKEYYDHIEKIGKDPASILDHGDDSASYLQKVKPKAITLITEVPYFYSEDSANKSDAEITLRQNWLDYIKHSREHVDKVQPLFDELLAKLEPGSPWHYKIKAHKDEYAKRNDAMKEYVMKDPSFDRKATKAEALDGVIGSYFYRGGLFFSQIYRAAQEAKLSESILKKLEEYMMHCDQMISKATEWQTIPIKNLVKLQAAVLNETLKELEQ